MSSFLRQISAFHLILGFCFFSFACYACACGKKRENGTEILQTPNILNYQISPDSAEDRKGLTFSDQGAWFAYGFPEKTQYYGGFSGPLLMTQENGIWASPVLSQLLLVDINSGEAIDWSLFSHTFSAYNSHIEQRFVNDQTEIIQKLYFATPHTAATQTLIRNKSNGHVELQPQWRGRLFSPKLHLSEDRDGITITSEKSPAAGLIRIPNADTKTISVSDTSYQIKLGPITLKPGETRELLLMQTFIFPEYRITEEKNRIAVLSADFDNNLRERIAEKEKQLETLLTKIQISPVRPEYKNLIVKCVLTMQNNWRIPAGELKHSGLFPSYHYIWFHGFWAWDSWKHAVALARYDSGLAKEQIRAMYDFMDERGFIADCVYRDTTIENHNYRNTKPPLSAWAVWEIHNQDGDPGFIKEMYDQIIRQHEWWYKDRDHDQDGICEYGSTDGTLVAAKWESGMDNAVRFDSSKILQNSESAFSLDQESVDLNAYLYAEKNYLSKMAGILNKPEDEKRFRAEAEELKKKIRDQFFDEKSGWFYDTSIDGNTFINVIGCEGWIPLWADAASRIQAEAVKNIMLNPRHFNLRLPLQTLSARNTKFEPDRGYWRGPNWLDQAYFGVKGLKNYGYLKEVQTATHKLIHNAEGLLHPGPSIRENYNPVTGKGLESENFSWSAAHYLLLLVE